MESHLQMLDGGGARIPRLGAPALVPVCRELDERLGHHQRCDGTCHSSEDHLGSKCLHPAGSKRSSACFTQQPQHSTGPPRTDKDVRTQTGAQQAQLSCYKRQARAHLSGALIPAKLHCSKAGVTARRAAAVEQCNGSLGLSHLHPYLAMSAHQGMSPRPPRMRVKSHSEAPHGRCRPEAGCFMTLHHKHGKHTEGGVRGRQAGAGVPQLPTPVPAQRHE